MTNLPPEPDEFQTRMRQSESEDTESTNRSGDRPAPPSPSPFAPPGLDGGNDPGTGPTGPAPAADPQSAPTAAYGVPGYAQQPPAPSAPAGYGQARQAPGPFGQASQPAGYGPGQPPAPPFGQAGQPAPGPQPTQPPFGYPGAGAPGQSGQPGPWSQLAPQGPREANPLKAAFDFSFGSYATPGLIKLIYIIAVALGVLTWLFYVVIGFASEPVVGVLALVLGWIPTLLFVLLLRVALEVSLAGVRTAMDVRVLRERSDKGTEKKD
jgi:hypothetical protein